MNGTRVTAIGSILLGTALAASAGSGSAELSQHQQDLFKKLDTDQNARVSQREAESKPVLEARFASLDDNGDMALNKAEFADFELRKSRGESEGTGR